LHRGYLAVLEARLVGGVGPTGSRAAAATSGPPSLDQTHAIDFATLRAHIAEAEAAGPGGGAGPLPSGDVPSGLEPFIARVANLRSGDVTRIRHGLHGALIGPDELPHVVPLLERDELS